MSRQAKQMSIYDIPGIVPNSSPKGAPPLTVFVQMGTGSENGKERVRRFFGLNPQSQMRVRFLKEEYGYWGYSAPGKEAGMISSFALNGDGVVIKYFDKDGVERKGKYTFVDIEKEIERLMKVGEY